MLFWDALTTSLSCVESGSDYGIKGRLRMPGNFEMWVFIRARAHQTGFCIHELQVALFCQKNPPCTQISRARSKSSRSYMYVFTSDNGCIFIRRKGLCSPILVDLTQTVILNSQGWLDPLPNTQVSVREWRAGCIVGLRPVMCVSYEAYDEV